MITENKSYLGEFKDFMKNVSPLYVIDHAGRAGNGFFQTLFDEHPEVLSIPWIHYCTSYFITQFGDATKVNSRKAHDFWTQKSYFRLLYSDLNNEDYRLVHRFGGNPETIINREMIRTIFDQLVLQRNTTSRKIVIFASFFAIAKAFNRDFTKIKYLILTDSISLREENIFTGFSGKIIDISIVDSPKAHFIHLVRDPRAGFASTVHQFINQLGNMYAVNESNFTKRILEILNNNLSMDGPFVFGFWILYFVQTYKTIEKQKNKYSQYFSTIWNEDLNLKFTKTIKHISTTLNVSMVEKWNSENYVTTMFGHKWKGTGAYNNRYQTYHLGPLRNDPDDISKKITGPNSYVTKRWRKKLKNSEIILLEIFFYEELKKYKYEFTKIKNKRSYKLYILIYILLPLSGEIPSFKWLINGYYIGINELRKRLFYYIFLPFFYIVSRLKFLTSKEIRNILR